MHNSDYGQLQEPEVQLEVELESEINGLGLLQVYY